MLLSRFTDLVTLPPGWAWLENGWVMTIVGVLLDDRGHRRQDPGAGQRQRRHPDVRPTDGRRHRVRLGHRRRKPPRSPTRARSHSPVSGFPIVIGVVTALVVSLTKSAVRPAANVVTAGVAAPVLSTVEDVTSVSLVFVAILMPVLVLVVAAGVGVRRVSTAALATAAQGGSRRPD